MGTCIEDAIAMIPHIPSDFNQFHYQKFRPAAPCVAMIKPRVVFLLHFLPVSGQASLQHQSPSYTRLVIYGGTHMRPPVSPRLEDGLVFSLAFEINQDCRPHLGQCCQLLHPFFQLRKTLLPLFLGARGRTTDHVFRRFRLSTSWAVCVDQHSPLDQCLSHATVRGNVFSEPFTSREGHTSHGWAHERPVNLLHRLWLYSSMTNPPILNSGPMNGLVKVMLVQVGQFVLPIPYLPAFSKKGPLVPVHVSFRVQVDFFPEILCHLVSGPS